MAKKLKSVNEKLSQAQTNKKCYICGKGGRTLARLGEIEINYCGRHRKQGERVINFLVASVFGEKLQAMLKESKDDLFMKNKPQLSKESYDALAEYTTSMVKKLDEIEKWQKKMKG